MMIHIVESRKRWFLIFLAVEKQNCKTLSLLLLRQEKRES